MRPAGYRSAPAERSVLMPSAKTKLGNQGEIAARRLLESQGYRILECNYRCRYGEIDIVAMDGNCTVFVEVRTKRSESFGTPEESLSKAKQRRLTMTALTYLQACETPPTDWRIDLVSVRLPMGSGSPRIDHVKYAVQAQSDGC